MDRLNTRFSIYADGGDFGLYVLRKATERNRAQVFILRSLILFSSASIFLPVVPFQSLLDPSAGQADVGFTYPGIDSDTFQS
jgi:hypothetical protein